MPCEAVGPFDGVKVGDVGDEAEVKWILLLEFFSTTAAQQQQSLEVTVKEAVETISTVIATHYGPDALQDEALMAALKPRIFGRLE